MNEHEQLNEALSAGEIHEVTRRAQNGSGPQLETVGIRPDQPPQLDFSQWQVGTNGAFRPAARTISHVEPGVYAIAADQFGLYIERKSVLCDEIVELPDSASSRVLDTMKRFWQSKGRYARFGLIYKRGILLWGPPGSGKTVTIHLLMRDLINLGGIVLLGSHPQMTADMIQIVRRIEPDRPLIVVMEDVDETISEFGERQILMMLDGETQIDNVVYLATTNYPERLGARIVNRPSRFDDRVLIGMPSLESRTAYLRRVASAASDSFLSEETIAQWAADTDGLSIAHLRELCSAVMCLDQDYAEVLERLRSMGERPKEIDGFAPKRGISLLAQQIARR